MTNIEKVKRILDAGHWVKVTWDDDTYTITSYHSNYCDTYSYIDSQGNMYCDIDISFDKCTIEVIQRIPTPYKSGDKVLVLSNPNPRKICEIRRQDGFCYAVFNEDKTDYWIFPAHCLAPTFDDEEISDTNRIISGKEAKIVIDGKEYTATLKLI